MFLLWSVVLYSIARSFWDVKLSKQLTSLKDAVFSLLHPSCFQEAHGFEEMKRLKVIFYLFPLWPASGELSWSNADFPKVFCHLVCPRRGGWCYNHDNQEITLILQEVDRTSTQHNREVAAICFFSLFISFHFVFCTAFIVILQLYFWLRPVLTDWLLAKYVNIK